MESWLSSGHPPTEWQPDKRAGITKIANRKGEMHRTTKQTKREHLQKKKGISPKQELRHPGRPGCPEAWMRLPKVFTAMRLTPIGFEKEKVV